MQFFHLSQLATILLIFAIWAAVPLAFAWFCLFLPDRQFDPNRFLWRAHRWERGGRVYESAFHVKRWKHLLPDGGGIFQSRGYQKRRLKDHSEENLRRFLIESARGELTHWLGILPFWVFGLFAPPYIVWIMLVYALAANLPCIIAQRYNRPRVSALLARLQAEHKSKKD
jgi:glycosyl-4,4'-diaponeurosporenoate acyltransferase